jgi:hypothetical protein
VFPTTCSIFDCQIFVDQHKIAGLVLKELKLNMLKPREPTTSLGESGKHSRTMTD